MDECRVADYSNTFLFRFGAACLVIAVQSGNRSAHADAGIHGAERCRGTQRIASDVAADIDPCFFQGIE